MAHGAEFTGVVQEHLGVMDELIHSFGPDDRGKVAAVQETLRELASIVAAKEKSAQELIHSMTHDVSRLEQEATPPEPAEAHQARVNNLTSEVEGAKARIKDGAAHVEHQQQHRQEIRARMAETDREKSKVATLRSQLDDAHKQLSLLKHISRMDLDSSVWPSRIRGVIVDMSEAGPRQFDFDASVSRTAMADQIWAMMDE